MSKFSTTPTMDTAIPAHQTQPSPVPFPDLPIDIARDIIEITALLDRRNARDLTGVSKLVRTWSDPVLYHTVILNTRAITKRFIYSITSRPAGALLVKNLCLWAGDGMGFASSWVETDRILLACKNIVRFSTVTRETKRLEKYLGDVGDGWTLQPRYLSLNIGMASSLEITVLPRTLTHLKLSYPRGRVLDWLSVFERCPNLSHLMFDFRDYTLLYDGELEVFTRHLLSISASPLQRLIINFYLPPKDVLEYVEKTMSDVKDERLVAISTDGAFFAAHGVSIAPLGEWVYLKDSEWDAWEVAEWAARKRLDARKLMTL